MLSQRAMQDWKVGMGHGQGGKAEEVVGFGRERWFGVTKFERLDWG